LSYQNTAVICRRRLLLAQYHQRPAVRKNRRLNNRKNIGIYYAIDLVNLDLQRDFGNFLEEEQELVKIV
jgi:hypothetical protein